MYDETRIEHEAFGKISLSRVSGEANLFMVDYPQGHFVTLTVKGARLGRRGASDYVYSQEMICELSLSEVQFARLISSMNTDGVPCTLNYYTDPKTGKFIAPKLPEKHAADKETYVDDVKNRAKATATGVNDALAQVETLLKTPGSIRKGDLENIRELLYHANMQLDANLPYVVESAEEAIETASESAKGEIEAHAAFVLDRLGREALGERLEQALAAGVDPSAIGEIVARSLDDKRPA